MSTIYQLSYGANRQVRLELGDSCDIHECRFSGDVLDDPASAAIAALSAPEGYPPIACACVPGDHVVVAIDADVPQPEAIIKGILEALRQNAVDIQTTVLCATATMAERLRAALTEVDIQVHCPDNHDQMTYLAASQQGDPIYFNRLLHEADVVIPVGAMRPTQALGYAGVNGGLFPTFSDTRTRSRFQSSNVHQRGDTPLSEQAAEAAWLLGIQFTVQVIPGMDGGVLQICAGDCATIERAAGEQCESSWTFDRPAPSSLVIAGIDGDDAQTWESFARALYVARQAADDDADILLCTTINCEPGPAILELGGDLVDEELERELQRRRSADAAVAALLFETLQTCRIHLVSDLPPALVQQLGIMPIDADEMEHLVANRRQCTIIPSAQRAALSPHHVEYEL